MPHAVLLFARGRVQRQTPDHRLHIPLGHWCRAGACSTRISAAAPTAPAFVLCESDGMISPWLETFAAWSLIAAGACSLIVLIDLLAGHRQHMWIMNVVWVITPLYSSALGL